MMRKSSFSFIINLEERNVDERHYGIIDWDTMHDFGMTPLLYAAKSSTIETFQLLLDFGTNIIARAQCNETVLHFAAGSADEDGEDIVKYLLDEMDSETMYVQNTLDRTPFDIALFVARDKAMSDIFLDHGYDLDKSAGEFLEFVKQSTYEFNFSNDDDWRPWYNRYIVRLMTRSNNETSLIGSKVSNFNSIN